MHNPQLASENVMPFSAQSTPIVVAAQCEDESVWDIWPYCWAIDGWDVACENVENQRANFALWKLARYNRRAQEKFYRKNWKARFLAHWHHTDDCDERDLKLV